MTLYNLLFSFDNTVYLWGDFCVIYAEYLTFSYSNIIFKELTAFDEIWYSKVTIVVCSLAHLPSQSKITIGHFYRMVFLIIIIAFPKIWLVEALHICDYIAVCAFKSKALYVLYTWLMLCVIISIVCAKYDTKAVLWGRVIEFWTVISGECLLESRFVERMWAIFTWPLWSSDHSDPRRPDLVILRLSLSHVLCCSLASL